MLGDGGRSLLLLTSTCALGGKTGERGVSPPLLTLLTDPLVVPVLLLFMPTKLLELWRLYFVLYL